jgi:photosystem II stability/assembly factor-like uncharacterized protein
MPSDSSAEAQPADLVYQFAAAAGGSRAHTAVYYAAQMSGLYVSEDEGEHWRLAYESLSLPEPLATLAVAAVPNDGQPPVVFAGCSGGLLRSPDGGRTWANIPLGEPPPAVTALALSPKYAQDGYLIAATLQDGVSYSRDRGAQWQTGNIGLIDPNVLCAAISPDFERDQTVLAGTQSGLFRSHNAGRSWREVDLPGGHEPIISLAFSPAYADDCLVLAGTETQGLLRSTDQGKSGVFAGRPALSQSINQILFSPDFALHPWLLALHEGSVFISKNAGDSWRRWKQAFGSSKPITALAAPRGFGPGDPVLAGFEGGEKLRSLAA